MLSAPEPAAETSVSRPPSRGGDGTPAEGAVPSSGGDAPPPAPPPAQPEHQPQQSAQQAPNQHRDSDDEEAQVNVRKHYTSSMGRLRRGYIPARQYVPTTLWWPPSCRSRTAYGARTHSCPRGIDWPLRLDNERPWRVKASSLAENR
ncbi:unnamed protein product [Nezara viridula]|uniref:Uncharacterized protein n=1 Tax=Nezara viridula TaxID=85310 RepID=A0A9P0H4H9_NEZVI|nr:unnamed protein product [Nezara viridula]